MLKNNIPKATIELILPLIAEIVESEKGRPLPTNILFRKLVNNNKQIGYVDKGVFEKAIQNLIDSKQIFRLKTGYLVIFTKKNNEQIVDHSETLTGIIHINSMKNGFISLLNEEKAKYFVSSENTNNAQNGDTVIFNKLNGVGKGDLIPAIVSSIQTHAKDFFVGEFVQSPNDPKYKVIVDDQKVNLNIILTDTSGLVNGSKFLFKIDKFDNNNAHSSVVRIIGHKSDVGTDIESIVYNNGAVIDFDDEVLNYAKKLKFDIKDESVKYRKDYRNKPIITIDPATSKDFDDAFYCEKLKNGNYLLSVHIADVSHYVVNESVLDKSALKRGSSIYLVDRVIPMLPHNLSDDTCSINPNVDRYCIACDMEINKNGEFKDIKVFPSIVHSVRRFSYDEVNEYIQDHKTDFKKEDKEVKKSIDSGLELSNILSKMKDKRGYIDFEIPEPTIIVDKNGEPTEIIVKPHGRAQKMIEDFMVAANEAVTIYANKKKYPFVYRIHDKPNKDQIIQFTNIAKKLNIKIGCKIDDDISSLMIRNIIEKNKDNPNIEIARMLLLRSMAKAKYDTNNIGHFGLASNNYTHFTSPIRRYPDLMVHRIFWELDFKKNNKFIRSNFINQLKEYCDISSKCELIATKCEREVNKMKFAQYMEKHINEEFTGYVNSVANFGFFVILDNLIEGFVSLRSFENIRYKFDEENNTLIGSNGHVISLCTKCRVVVVLADRFQKKIEFKVKEWLK